VARVRLLLDLLFPSRCLGCGLRGVSLCSACRPTVPWLGAESCPRCARPSRLARICQRCRAGPPALDGVRAACRFEGIVRKAVHDLKYRGIRERAGLLGDLVAEAIERRPLAIDLIVPVPLAGSRRKQRGFNQAELIARRLGEHTATTMLGDGLARVRETPPQVGRSGPERLVNVAGAFACRDAGPVAGRRVAVVDDVMTTGATLGACAEVLRAAGAARVFGIVVAREI
jgi:ComF family protein